MNIRDVVVKHFAAIVAEHSPVPCPEHVTDDLLLEEFWLDSVALVAFIARLEQELGYVPPAVVEGAFYPETIGEFVALYADAAPERT